MLKAGQVKEIYEMKERCPRSHLADRRASPATAPRRLQRKSVPPLPFPGRRRQNQPPARTGPIHFPPLEEPFYLSHIQHQPRLYWLHRLCHSPDLTGCLCRIHLRFGLVTGQSRLNITTFAAVRHPRSARNVIPAKAGIQGFLAYADIQAAREDGFPLSRG